MGEVARRVLCAVRDMASLPLEACASGVDVHSCMVRQAAALSSLPCSICFRGAAPISIRRIERAGPSSGPDDNAAWELGVHIADVSYFVQPGTPLDDEAQKRGNSTYLPRKVIPMLPELLSNGVCSLQEGVPRLCKSAFITIGEDARPAATRVANTILNSAKRLRYIEAQGYEAELLAQLSPAERKALDGLLDRLLEAARSLAARPTP